jgi:hypothetical protein
MQKKNRKEIGDKAEIYIGCRVSVNADALA